MNKIFKSLAIAIIGIAAFLLLMQLAVSVFLPNIIKHKLESGVSSASKGEYQLNIGKVTVNIFRMSMSMRSAELNFTSDLTDSLQLSETKVSARVENLNFSGINLIEFLQKKNIYINQIVIDSPDVKFIRSAESKRDSSQGNIFNSKDIFKNFHSIQIGSLITRKSVLTILNKATDTLPSFDTKNINIAMKNVKFDSATFYSHHRLFDAENAFAVIKNIAYVTPDSLFELSIPSTTVSYTNNSIHVDSFHLSPRYPLQEFLRRVPVEKDYLDVFIRSIDLGKADIKRLLEQNECWASSMMIDSMIVHSYRDKNLADSKKSKPMPQDLLHNCPFTIALDSALLKNTSVFYRERACDATEPGSVWFTNINAVLRNVTNDSILHRQDTLSIHATGMLMGTGRAEVNFHFPLFDPAKVFFGDGKVSAMSMTRLNPMLEKNASISVKHGMMEELRFRMWADIHESKGTLSFLYDSLEISKLNKYDKTDNKFPEKIISVVANLLLNKNNPDEESSVKEVPMHWVRDPSRSIFNYVWKTLFTGIKQTLNVPKGKSTTIGTVTCP